MVLDELKHILSYDEYTGIFKWNISPSKRVNVGDIAGSCDEYGYCRIRYKYKNYKAHRLAWLYMYGEYPKFVDHINRNRMDNSISNLRSVTISENNRNKSKNINCAHGVTGVYFSEHHQKWKPTIGVDGKTINLGYYSSFDDAVAIRKNAEIIYGFSDTHGE